MKAASAVLIVAIVFGAKPFWPPLSLMSTGRWSAMRGTRDEASGAATGCAGSAAARPSRSDAANADGAARPSATAAPSKDSVIRDNFIELSPMMDDLVDHRASTARIVRRDRPQTCSVPATRKKTAARHRATAA